MSGEGAFLYYKIRDRVDSSLTVIRAPRIIEVPGNEARGKRNSKDTTMSIQEIEELEFAPRTEAQNCFTEAQERLAQLATEAVEYGDGPIRVTVSAPYYCRATDAFVGMYPLHIHHVHSQEEARAVALLYECYDDETRVDWVDPAARAAWEANQADDLARQAAEADPNSDQYVPF